MRGLTEKQTVYPVLGGKPPCTRVSSCVDSVWIVSRESVSFFLFLRFLFMLPAILSHDGSYDHCSLQER